MADVGREPCFHFSPCWSVPDTWQRPVSNQVLGRGRGRKPGDRRHLICRCCCVSFQVEEVFPVQPGVWRPCHGFNDLYVDTQPRAPRVDASGPQHHPRTVHPEPRLLYLVYLCPGAYRGVGTPAQRACVRPAGARSS